MDTSSTITPVAPRKKMPAEVFIKLWQIGVSIINGKDWNGEELTVEIFQNNIGRKQIKFSNLEIEGPIQPEGHNRIFRLGLILNNCQFEKIIFDKVRVEPIIFSGNSVGGDISIQDSDIVGISVWESSKISGLFVQNSSIGDLSVRRSQTGPLWINTSKIGKCSITQGSKIGFLNLMQNSSCGDFFVESSITGNLFINSSNIGDIKFENAKSGNIEFRENSTGRRFSFLTGSILGDVKIVNSKATIISVSEETKLAKLRVWHSELQRIDIKYSFIGELKCQFTLQGPIHAVFENSKIGFFNFNNVVLPEFTTLNISNCSINYLKLSNFCNYGSMFFSNLLSLQEWEDYKKNETGIPIFKDEIFLFESKKGASTLHLSDSDLGRIQFINCDLRKFDRFEFSNTKMLDVFVAGSKMPGEKAFCLPNEEENPLKIAEQKRLAYGQFKKIYEARGDTARSLLYLTYEMEAYRKHLQKLGWWKYKGELVMLWMNKVSNNYGFSWQRGLGITFLAVTFFYSIFCFLIGYRFENNSPDDVERFWEVVSYAPYYLNPLRDLDSVFLVPDKDFTPAARIWDFISRIFVAYFVYQTIQAFRKLGKSSG